MPAEELKNAIRDAEKRIQELEALAVQLRSSEDTVKKAIDDLSQRLGKEVFPLLAQLSNMRRYVAVLFVLGSLAVTVLGFLGFTPSLREKIVPKAYALLNKWVVYPLVDSRLETALSDTVAVADHHRFTLDGRSAPSYRMRFFAVTGDTMDIICDAAGRGESSLHGDKYFVAISLDQHSILENRYPMRDLVAKPLQFRKHFGLQPAEIQGDVQVFSGPGVTPYPWIHQIEFVLAGPAGAAPTDFAWDIDCVVRVAGKTQLENPSRG